MRFFELIEDAEGSSGSRTQRQAADAQWARPEAAAAGAAGGDSPTLVMQRTVSGADSQEEQQ